MQTSSPARRLQWRELLFMPIGCLLQSSPLVLFALIAVIGGVLYLLYTTTNISLPGLATRPGFFEWSITNGYTQIANPSGKSWSITYEASTDSTFTGTVRHVSPIRLPAYPMLTHDILVTRGDYANSDRVRTMVFNHHFYWSARDRAPIDGSIHLLHALPQSEEIYNQLLEIRPGDSVQIIGREILRVDAFRPSGDSAGFWADSGCNTLLVEAVRIFPAQE